MTIKNRDLVPPREGRNIFDVNSRQVHLCFLWLGLLVGEVLLLVAPMSKPIWTDETASINAGNTTYWSILTGNASDTQPPLHLLVMRICLGIFGYNLVAFRLVSALPAVVTLWYVYQIGRRISTPAGLLALWLAALSPGLILFDRMARYHGLLALLTAMSVYYGLVVLERGRRQDSVICAAATFLSLMTYYLSLFVPCALLFAVIIRWRHEPHRWRLLGAIGIAIVFFLPWFVHGLIFAHSNINMPNVEDPRMSLGVSGFIRRVALPVYSFCLGGTVSPWNWPIVLVAVPAILGAFLLGGIRLRSTHELILPLVCVSVVVLSALATSGKFGTSQGVGTMDKRVSFALPLFYVVVSAGIMAFRLRPARIFWASLILLVSIYAVRNYWTDQQFLNLNYVARWDQVVHTIQQTQSTPDTVIYCHSEPTLHYYLDRAWPQARYLDGTKMQQISQGIVPTGDHYLWVMGRDRGERIAVDDVDAYNRQLSLRYHKIASFGIMPQSMADRYWSGKFLKRPIRPYYIWLDLYDLSSTKDAK